MKRMSLIFFHHYFAIAFWNFPQGLPWKLFFYYFTICDLLSGSFFLWRHIVSLDNSCKRYREEGLLRFPVLKFCNSCFSPFLHSFLCCYWCTVYVNRFCVLFLDYVLKPNDKLNRNVSYKNMKLSTNNALGYHCILEHRILWGKKNIWRIVEKQKYFYKNIVVGKLAKSCVMWK